MRAHRYTKASWLVGGVVILLVWFGVDEMSTKPRDTTRSLLFGLGATFCFRQLYSLHADDKAAEEEAKAREAEVRATVGRVARALGMGPAESVSMLQVAAEIARRDRAALRRRSLPVIQSGHADDRP